jgi:hypothetical protein
VVGEIRDSVVGADFLKVSLVRVTARGARAFLSCTGTPERDGLEINLKSKLSGYFSVG